MKKYLIALTIIILSMAKAYAAAPTPLAYTSTANPQIQINVTPTSPLPIAVYDQSNNSGYCLTSNGSASAATFQACSGGGGGSAIAIQATTSNLTYYPMLATTTGGAVGTVYVDTTSPFPYNPSTGTLSALALVTTSLIDHGNASLQGTTTISSVQILAGNGVFTNITATNASLVGTTTIGTLQVTGNSVLGGTTTISSAQISSGNALFTTITSTTDNATTINFTNALGTTITATNIEGIGNAKLAGTTTVANLSITGTCVGCTSTPPGSPAQSIQYNSASGFAGATGLYYSTTRSGLDFLANVTTANLVSLGNNGADVTSYALGESALLAQSTTNLDNTAIGGFALAGLTTGSNNTALGWDAGQSITNDGYNTAIGSQALLTMAANGTTSSTGNVAIGYRALGTTSTGTGMVAIGNLAMASETKGGQDGNTAVGTQALSAFTRNNSTGNNTALGYLACAAVTSGFQDTCVGAGSNAGAGTQDVISIGRNSGSQNLGNTNIIMGNSACTSCNGNTSDIVIGISAASAKLTSGSSNIIIGSSAATTNLTTGSGNVLIGSGSGEDTALATTTSAVGLGGSNRPGSTDVAIGVGALAATITNANQSTAVGYKALTAVTTGINNTAYGFNSGLAVTVGSNNTMYGVSSGNKITTGGSNVIIGPAVGSTTLTIGSNNILIGTTSAIDATTSAVSNTMNLAGILTTSGLDAAATSTTTARGSYFLTDISSDAGVTDASVCEDTTTHKLYAGSGTLGVCLGTSSARYKQDIHPLLEGLDKIGELKPVSFYYRKGHGDNGVKRQFGFLAEDMILSIPKLVDTDKDGKPNSVDLVGLIPILVHSMQEQQKEINDLKKRAK